MGFFYYVRAVALMEDLPMPENKQYNSAGEFYAEVDKGFTLNAQNCWIAACLYLFTLAFSGYQFYVNSRSSVM
ncbi:unnamed protein product [Bemisia tabaci]|uniref:Uncharacterized protein n=2 Tax=Bemisia tabaci TaxID=7038 RepID=A0A9P0G5L6_BEMTA|nr:unnamed protein product [Bemisia tabaci]